MNYFISNLSALLWQYVIGILFISQASSVFASTDYSRVSVVKGGLAPNAGGQEVYAARLGTMNWEGSLIQNRSLTVDDKPLTMASFNLLWHGCDDCFWDLFLATGGGLSNAGPIMELSWVLTAPLLPVWLPTPAPRYVPQLRVEVSSIFIFTSLRPSTWSHPLCVGVAFPF